MRLAERREFAAPCILTKYRGTMVTMYRKDIQDVRPAFRPRHFAHDKVVNHSWKLTKGSSNSQSLDVMSLFLASQPYEV